MSGSYDSWNVNDLKGELRKRNLSVAGRKSELVERLNSSIDQDSSVNEAPARPASPRRRSSIGSKTPSKLQHSSSSENIHESPKGSKTPSQGVYHSTLPELDKNSKGTNTDKTWTAYNTFHETWIHSWYPLLAVFCLLVVVFCVPQAQKTRICQEWEPLLQVFGITCGKVAGITGSGASAGKL